MTNSTCPECSPSCVTYLRTRSKKPPEKSYDLFDLTSPSVSLCHSCIIVLWPKVRARQALALRCPWRLALPATESCWGLSLCRKSPFDFNDVIYSIFQGQFRNTSSEQIRTRKHTSSSSPLLLPFPSPLHFPPPPPLSRTALKV